MLLKHAVGKFIFCLAIFLMGHCNHSFSQFNVYRDTSKVSFSVFAKGGIIYDYPFYNSYSDLGPMGEIGMNVILGKIQIGLGIGYFPNNSHWNQGSDAFTPAKRGITNTGAVYFPLHINFKFFNIKRNILSMKIGFDFMLSTKTTVNETWLYPTYTIDYSFNYTTLRFGLGGTVGIKYSRLINRHFLVGAEIGINVSMVPGMAFGADYTYGTNMTTRHPNGDFKLCFEYFFGKNHNNYFNETKFKPKKERGNVIDEE